MYPLSSPMASKPRLADTHPSLYPSQRLIDSPNSAHIRLYTLPVAGSIWTDVESKEHVPFAVAISADSYRTHKMKKLHEESTKNAKAMETNGTKCEGGFLLPSVDCRSYAQFHTRLTPTDLYQLCDALLCNTTLTSIHLSHSSLDPHAIPPLVRILSQHPTLTSIDLSHNELGLHPDSEELRTLFQALASEATLPHLMEVKLANK